MQVMDAVCILFLVKLAGQAQASTVLFVFMARIVCPS